MKKFLALYLGSVEALANYRAKDEATLEALDKSGMESWMKWSKEHEASIVDGGTPLGKTMRVSTDGVSDTVNEIGGYTIVKAETHEAAARMFINHPHFMMFSGESVEIIECLPMPSV